MTGPAPGSPLRLDWRVLVVHAVTFRQARAILSSAGPIALIVALRGNLGSTGLITIAVVATLASLALSALRWWRFSYELDAHRLLVRQGLLSRSERAVPLDRIRGVDVEAPALHRLFRIAVLRVDAAAGTGGQDEAVLDALATREAERLREVLLHRDYGWVPPPSGVGWGQDGQPTAGWGPRGEPTAAWAPNGGTDPPAPTYGGSSPWSPGAAAEPPGVSGGQPHPAWAPSGQAGSWTHGAGAASPGAEPGGPAAAVRVPGAAPPQVYARLDPRWLLYAPLVGGYLAVPLAIGGTLLRDVENLPIPAGLRDLVRIPEQAGAGRIALSILGAVAVVVLGALIAGAVSNWGFVLASRGGNLVAERGLLTRRTVTLEIARIRGYVLSQGLGIRLVGAARLTALVTGLGDQNRRGQLLPLGPLHVAERVAARAVRPFDAPLEPHPPAALRRRLFRAIGPPLLLSVLLALLDLPVAATVAGLAAILGVVLGMDRYRALGHGADADALAVRSGSLLRRRVVLEQRAVVGWRVQRSLFQRWAGLVTLTACVGAGEGGYDVLDCSTAQGLDLVAVVSPGWAGPLEAPPRPPQHP